MGKFAKFKIDHVNYRRNKSLECKRIAIFFEITQHEQNPYTPIFGLVGIGVAEISE